MEPRAQDDGGLSPRTTKVAVQLGGLALMVVGVVRVALGDPLALMHVVVGCGMAIEPTRSRSRLLDLVAAWLDRR